MQTFIWHCSPQRTMFPVLFSAALLSSLQRIPRRPAPVSYTPLTHSICSHGSLHASPWPISVWFSPCSRRKSPLLTQLLTWCHPRSSSCWSHMGYPDLHWSLWPDFLPGWRDLPSSTSRRTPGPLLQWEVRARGASPEAGQCSERQLLNPLAPFYSLKSSQQCAPEKWMSSTSDFHHFNWPACTFCFL